MADPRDEREGRDSEDLFDDLDKFFAPIEETDWPEPSSPPPPDRESAAPAAEEPAAPDESPFGREPEAEDRRPAARGRGRRGDREAEPEPEPTDPFAGSQPIDDAAWAEIGGGFAGEGEQEESFLFGSQPGPEEPSPPADQGPSYSEPGFGVPGEDELTLDDLKVAPPEYAELPGAGEAERRGPREPAAEEPVAPGGAAPEDVSVAATFDADEETGMRAEGPGPQEEPSFGATFDEVGPGPQSPAEEAAAHFAEGMRTTPEDVEEDLLAGLSQPEAAGPRTVRVGDEPFTGAGPAWEEPTGQTVVADEQPAAPAGRNLPAALVSGVALAALALILLAIGSAPFAILAAVVVLLAQGEVYAVARKRGFQPATALGLVTGALLLWAAYNRGEDAMGFVLGLGAVLTFLWYMAAPAKARKGTLQNAGITILGLVYVPFFAGFLFRLMPLPGGRAIVLTIVALTVLYDVAAFGVGFLWGHRPLAPTISPNKSWEGAIAASLVAVFLALAFVPQIEPFTLGTALGLALVVVVAAPLGDLAESALKRDLGVKDMSTILPGHGGLMDRIDSLLFVAPAAFYFLRVAF